MIDALVDAVVDAGRGADAADAVDDDHSNDADAGTFLFLFCKLDQTELRTGLKLDPNH